MQSRLLQQRPAPCVVRRTCSVMHPLRAATLVQRQTRQRLHVCCAQKVADLPVSLQKIVGAFQMVPDPMARYKQLLFYANKLDALPAEDHIPSNKVEGCVSQVWVKPQLKEDGKIYWKADSDSQLTKGLAALLVLGLSGCSPAEILKVEPGFIEMLGLKQSLTPSRNNGFLNMFKLMQRKTLEVVAASAKESTPSSSSSNGNGSTHSSSLATAASSDTSTAADAHSNSSSSATSTSRTPVQDGIRSKLTSAMQPEKLVIMDQSEQHAGHAAMRAVAGKAGSSGETHFRVEIVSSAFEGKNQVQRQRWVYQLLQEEFGMGLHALSLDTRTPAEMAR